MSALKKLFHFHGALASVLLVSCTFSSAQTSPTQTPSQTPKTAPQVKQVLPSYEGQKVTTVELAGRPDVDPAQFLPIMAQQPGQPFSQARVDQSIAVLKRTGKFNDVQLEVRPEAQGVRVLLVLQPAMYFGIYDFPGALGVYPYSRLLQIANYPPRGAFTAVDVQQASQALQRFFQRTGFFLAEVQPQIQTDPQHGLVNVVFNTRLGKRAKFGEVNITGADPQETAHLQAVLRSFLARLRGSALRPGKTFKLKTLQNATQYLEDALTKQDHLAAKVQLIGANYNRDTNRADISFHVEPGPLVHVEVQGAHLWPWTRKKLLPVYAQIGVDPELIQEGRQNLISNFQSKGYFDTQVKTVVTEQGPGRENIVYQITKGPRHSVEKVGITGNEHMNAKDLMSHVAVEKKHLILSHGKYSQSLVRNSVKNLEGVYKAAGYSDVKVTPEVTNQNGNITVTFRVYEGEQDIVEALNLDGNTVPATKLAPQGLKLEPGRAYSQKAADDDRTQIMSTYLNLGYLVANFRETASKIPGQPHRIQVTYHINEGPQVHTASIITLGRKRTNPRLIAINTKEIQPEEPLRETDLLTAESELYTTSVFDWAEVDPRRTITTQTQEDVVIKVHESKRNDMTYGFGFEVINRGGSVPSGTVALPGLPPVGLPSSFKTSQKTFYGPRATIEYTRKNLFGKAESLTFSGLAGRLDQRASALFSDPNFRWSSWSSNFTVSSEHNSENPIFTSRQGKGEWQLQKPLDRKKTKNVFLRYSFTETGLTRLLIPDLVPPSDRHVRLSTVSASYIRDTRDNTLDAHKGIYQSFETDFSPSVLGSNFSFSKLLAQTAYYRKIPADIVWANSIRIGLEDPFAGSHVPISERFFTGGGSTLRGFPLNGAGPQHSIPACGNPSDRSTCSFITVPVGGNELFIVNSELRIPVSFVKKGLGIATFYDGGNVYERVGFHQFWSNYTNSVGIGLRYATPVGPVRIDLGHNLSPIPGIKSTQIFITLGQAF